MRKTPFLLVLLLLVPLALAAQKGSNAASSMPANAIDCGPDIAGAPLPTIPEISAGADGILRGTLYTVSEQVKMTAKGPGGTTVCYPQWVRAYRPDAPKSWNPPSSELLDPMTGPTLRARVGQMVELTFLNSIDSNKFPNVDQGRCDETSLYPANTGDKDHPRTPTPTASPARSSRTSTITARTPARTRPRTTCSSTSSRRRAIRRTTTCRSSPPRA